MVSSLETGELLLYTGKVEVDPFASWLSVVLAIFWGTSHICFFPSLPSRTFYTSISFPVVFWANSTTHQDGKVLTVPLPLPEPLLFPEPRDLPWLPWLLCQLEFCHPPEWHPSSASWGGLFLSLEPPPPLYPASCQN